MSRPSIKFMEPLAIATISLYSLRRFLTTGMITVFNRLINAMPRLTKYAQQDTSTPGGRVEYLLCHIWGGSQTRMAAEIGISQAVISKVARGEQEPGPKLLGAIAADPRVNAPWVFGGTGEPLSPSAPERSNEGCSLPVAACILPGLPAKHAGLLSGMQQSVAPADHRASRYLLLARASDRIVRVPRLKIYAGDVLLMEADEAAWGGNWRVLADKLVAVRHRGEQGLEYAMVGCGVDSQGTGPKFDSFGAVLMPDGENSQPILPSVIPQQPRKRSRGILISDESTDSETGPTVASPTTDQPTTAHEFSIRDVVGFCMKMTRNY